MMDRQDRQDRQQVRPISNLRCRFCRENITDVDYKDVQVLQKLCTAQGKFFSRKRSGNCARHQRIVKRALKRARYMALMPYTV